MEETGLNQSQDDAQTDGSHVNDTAVERENKQNLDLVFELDEAAHCQWVNERVKQAFGDVRGKHIEEIFSDRPEILEQYQRVEGGHEFIYFEVPEEHSWVIQGIRAEDGKLSGSVITGQPVDARAKPLRLAPSAWSYDILTNHLEVSDAVADVFGFKKTKLHFDKRTQIENIV